MGESVCGSSQGEILIKEMKEKREKKKVERVV